MRWEKRLALTAEANLEDCGGVTNSLAQNGILDHQAKCREVEKSVKSRS